MEIKSALTYARFERARLETLEAKRLEAQRDEYVRCTELRARLQEVIDTAFNDFCKASFNRRGNSLFKHDKSIAMARVEQLEQGAAIAWSIEDSDMNYSSLETFNRDFGHAMARYL